jgi:hypothetical protein
VMDWRSLSIMPLVRTQVLTCGVIALVPIAFLTLAIPNTSMLEGLRL